MSVESLITELAKKLHAINPAFESSYLLELNAYCFRLVERGHCGEEIIKHLIRVDTDFVLFFMVQNDRTN
jgi:hypothetical protein